MEQFESSSGPGMKVGKDKILWFTTKLEGDLNINNWTKICLTLIM